MTHPGMLQQVAHFRQDELRHLGARRARDSLLLRRFVGGSVAARRARTAMKPRPGAGPGIPQLTGVKVVVRA
jgi:hypothetical protein